MESNKTAEIIKAARAWYDNAPQAKLDVLSWDIKLDLAKSREIVINPLDHLTVEDRVEPRPLGMHLVRSSVIGLSPMEVAAIEQYNRPHPEALAWLAQHSDNKDGTPRKHIHSHAIDHLLTDDELAMWDKADGWHWSFKYGLAWRKSDGKLSEIKPNKDGRLMVLGKGLYWWIAMEWLARIAPNTAVAVMRGNFEIHHLKPYLMDRPIGNALENLRILRAQPEHSYISSAQRKIRKYYREHYI